MTPERSTTMTRCTCLWTAAPAEDSLELAVLLGDPMCPATPVHERTAARTSCGCSTSGVVGHRICQPA